MDVLNNHIHDLITLKIPSFLFSLYLFFFSFPFFSSLTFYTFTFVFAPLAKNICFFTFQFLFDYLWLQIFAKYAAINCFI